MKLSNKLVHTMAESKIIEQDEINVYHFGMQLLLETVISFVIFLIIATLFGSVSEVIIFTTAFGVLRQYGGGGHADKFISCLLISCGIVTSFCVIIHLPDWITYLIGILAIISLIIILWLAPVDSKYKPVSNSDRKKYRKKLMVLLFMEIIIATVIGLYSVHFSMCILFSWIVLSIMLVIGKIKNKYSHF